MRPCSANGPFALPDETRGYWLQSLSLKFFRRECGELRVLRLETRVLYMKLAFGVLDLENFKSALLSSLDANMTSPASQTRVWRTLHLEVEDPHLHLWFMPRVSHIRRESNTRLRLDPYFFILRLLNPCLQFMTSVLRLCFWLSVSIIAEI